MSGVSGGGVPVAEMEVWEGSYLLLFSVGGAETYQIFRSTMVTKSLQEELRTQSTVSLAEAPNQWAGVASTILPSVLRLLTELNWMVPQSFHYHLVCTAWHFS